MREYFLGVEEFESRLNLDGFTNIEKGYTTKDFNSTFGRGDYLIFEEANVANFISSVNKVTGGNIVKGGFNDSEEIKEVVEKAKQQLSSLKKIRINDGDGNKRNVYVMPKPTEEFSKAQENDIEKSHVSSAFQYSDKFKFKKKGKELIEKIFSVKEDIEVENEEIADKISEALTNLSKTPTEKPSLWGIKENVKVPFKVFNWNQTYYHNDGGLERASCIGETSGENCMPCESHEEAKANSAYNSLVHQWIDNQSEIILLNLFEKNINENETYELSAEQMLALKF